MKTEAAGNSKRTGADLPKLKTGVPKFRQMETTKSHVTGDSKRIRADVPKVETGVSRFRQTKPTETHNKFCLSKIEDCVPQFHGSAMKIQTPIAEMISKIEFSRMLGLLVFVSKADKEIIEHKIEEGKVFGRYWEY